MLALFGLAVAPVSLFAQAAKINKDADKIIFFIVNYLRICVN